MSEAGLVEDCPRRGDTMNRMPMPPTGQRLWRWFNYGPRPHGQLDYECQSCGYGLSLTAFSPGRSSLRGRIDHVRSQRALEPVPRFYAIVATAGMTVGWLVSRLSGRWHERWQVPVAALCASWLFMESSVLWGQPCGCDFEPSIGTDPIRD